jgi:ElaA protein
MSDHSDSAPALSQKTWSELSTTELYAFLKLRTDVFFLEQKIDETELDDRDREAATRHFWLADASGVVVAYLRVLRDSEPELKDARLIIGRVVVDPAHRGRGYAQQLLAQVMEHFEGQAMLLHAQEYIVPLYSGFGFEPVGEPFLEAGLRHQSMYRAASGLGVHGESDL